MFNDVRRAVRIMVESVSPTDSIKELVIFDDQGLPVHIEQGRANEATVARLGELVRVLPELSSEIFDKNADSFDIRIGREIIVLRRVSGNLWGAAFVEKKAMKKLVLRAPISDRDEKKPWMVEEERI